MTQIRPLRERIFVALWIGVALWTAAMWLVLLFNRTAAMWLVFLFDLEFKHSWLETAELRLTIVALTVSLVGAIALVQYLALGYPSPLRLFTRQVTPLLNALRFTSSAAGMSSRPIEPPSTMEPQPSGPSSSIEQTSIKVHCLHCGEGFHLPIAFGSIEIFEGTAMADNMISCPHCRMLTALGKENVRFVSPIVDSSAIQPSTSSPARQASSISTVA